MFDWQGLGFMVAMGAVLGILGYFMCLRWLIVTGNAVEPGVTKPFLVKMWVCIGFVAPVMHLLYQFHIFR
jgi:hypothetical protein